MYYVCNIHKSGSRIVSVEVCDTNDGVVDLVPIRDLKRKYGRIKIDGVSGLVKMSNHAKNFKNNCISALLENKDRLNHVMNTKSYINLAQVYYDNGGITPMIEYDGSYYSCLCFEVCLVFNSKGSHLNLDISISLCLFKGDTYSQHQGTFKTINASCEFVKVLYDAVKECNHDLVVKVLNCYFHNLGGLYKNYFNSYDDGDNKLKLDKSIRDIGLDDSRLTIRHEYQDGFYLIDN